MSGHSIALYVIHSAIAHSRHRRLRPGFRGRLVDRFVKFLPLSFYELAHCVLVAFGALGCNSQCLEPHVGARGAVYEVALSAKPGHSTCRNAFQIAVIPHDI
jgi:hypothetical protein